MSVFIRMTGGADFRELHRDGSVLTARYARPDGKNVLAAWTETGSRSATVAGQLETIVDLMGADRPVSGAIELTEDPLYLVGRELKVEVSGE